MSMEGIPNFESTEKERLLEVLKREKLNSSESQSLLDAWMTRKMNEITECDNAERPRLQVQLEVDRIELYEALDDQEEARNQAVQAFILARNEGLEDLMEY